MYSFIFISILQALREAYYIYMYMYTYIHTYIHTYMYTYTHIHVYIHTHTHTRARTHVCPACLSLPRVTNSETYMYILHVFNRNDFIIRLSRSDYIRLHSIMVKRGVI